MSFVECHGMSSHQPAHDFAERRGPCSDEQMDMVWNQCPSIALGLRLFKNDSQAVEEGFAALVVSENFASFNSTGHHMLKKAWCIKSG